MHFWHLLLILICLMSDNTLKASKRFSMRSITEHLKRSEIHLRIVQVMQKYLIWPEEFKMNKNKCCIEYV